MPPVPPGASSRGPCPPPPSPRAGPAIGAMRSPLEGQRHGQGSTGALRPGDTCRGFAPAPSPAGRASWHGTRGGRARDEAMAGPGGAGLDDGGRLELGGLLALGPGGPSSRALLGIPRVSFTCPPKDLTVRRTGRMTALDSRTQDLFRKHPKKTPMRRPPALDFSNPASSLVLAGGRRRASLRLPSCGPGFEGLELHPSVGKGQAVFAHRQDLPSIKRSCQLNRFSLAV